jgi:hypothetical protein
MLRKFGTVFPDNEIKAFTHGRYVLVKSFIVESQRLPWITNGNAYYIVSKYKYKYN